MSIYKCILIILLLVGAETMAQTNFEIRYLGNMGVAIIHKDSAIIIDGLHDYYDKYYLPTDTIALGEILQKKKPFKKIVAIAFTHKHSDHFDSLLVTNVANSNTSAKLIGGNQTKSLLGISIQKRFIIAENNLSQVINSNIKIVLKKIPHINPARHATVENYRIEVVWNGFHLVHLGDADIQPVAIEGLNQAPDVVVMPDWFLNNKAIHYLNQLKPKNIILSHIDPAGKKVNKPEKLKNVLIQFMGYGDKITIKS